MLANLKSSLWTQFGATIDMLRRAIEAMPEDKWVEERRFYYTAFHTLSFLDYYLTNPPADFQGWLPFTLTDKDKLPPEALDDVIPSRNYSKQELLDYCAYCRNKAKTLIEGLTEETVNGRWIEYWNGQVDRDFSQLEILFYNMRHVAQHVGQLNQRIRELTGKSAGWLSWAEA